MKIISGGQTGVDQAALRAAKACGLETGGFAPKGWKTEDGPSPWLAGFGLTEADTADYPARTAMNVRAVSHTLILSDGMSPGTRATIGACSRCGSGYSLRGVFDGGGPSAAEVAAALLRHAPKVLNVAGNRESSAPGVGEWAERFLAEVFREMARLATPAAPA